MIFKSTLGIKLAYFELLLISIIVVIVILLITTANIEIKLATVSYDHFVRFLVVKLPFVIIKATISIDTASLKFKLEQFNFFVAHPFD